MCKDSGGWWNVYLVPQCCHKGSASRWAAMSPFVFFVFCCFTYCERQSHKRVSMNHNCDYVTLIETSNYLLVYTTLNKSIIGGIIFLCWQLLSFHANNAKDFLSIYFQVNAFKCIACTKFNVKMTRVCHQYCTAKHASLDGDDDCPFVVCPQDMGSLLVDQIWTSDKFVHDFVWPLR